MLALVDGEAEAEDAKALKPKEMDKCRRCGADLAEVLHGRDAVCTDCADVISAATAATVPADLPKLNGQIGLEATLNTMTDEQLERFASAGGFDDQSALEMVQTVTQSLDSSSRASASGIDRSAEGDAAPALVASASGLECNAEGDAAPAPVADGCEHPWPIR